MGPPVSEKKLIEDGTWALRKEVLGWLFDGLARTIELPQKKCKEILTELKDVRRIKRLELKRFQKLHGRLQFTSISIPCGKPIMGQLDRYLATAGKTNKRYINMTDDLRNILRDWSALLRLVGRRPTHVKELVEHRPQYQGFVDASKWGVGGVWFGGTSSMIPIVWFIEWPQEIRDQFCSSSNKTGTITISDLELTGILLHWLVLEQAVDTTTLKHNSVAIWCDNLPAVAWTYKFRTSTSPIAARILRALAVRLHEQQTALLSVEHISGIFNTMADVASRKHNTNNTAFLTDFSIHFPPPQGACWTLFQFSDKVTSKIFSELLNQQSTLESWRRLSKKGHVFGQLGEDSSTSTFKALTPSLVHSLNQNESMCWFCSHSMCVPEAFLQENEKFEPKQSKYRYAPLQRSLKWTDNLTRWLRRKENIIKKSANLLRGTDATTHPRNTS